MIIKTLLPSFALCCSLSFAGTEGVVGAGVRYKTFVGSIKPPDFKKWAEGLLLSKAVTLGVVRAFPTKNDALLAGSRGNDHCSFDQWSAFIAANGVDATYCPAVQEAVKLRNNIILRTLKHDCHFSQSIITGDRNPLEQNISGFDVQIFYISISAGYTSAHIFHPDVLVYAGVSKSAATERLSKAVLQVFHGIIPSANLAVMVRPDPYFLDDCRFPAIYGFSGVWPLRPSRNDFLGGKEVVCSVGEHRPVRCLSFK